MSSRDMVLRHQSVQFSITSLSKTPKISSIAMGSGGSKKSFLTTLLYDCNEEERQVGQQIHLEHQIPCQIDSDSYCPIHNVFFILCLHL